MEDMIDAYNTFKVFIKEDALVFHSLDWWVHIHQQFTVNQFTFGYKNCSYICVLFITQLTWTIDTTNESLSAFPNLQSISEFYPEYMWNISNHFEKFNSIIL